MPPTRRNETEFAIGISLACIGALLLYTEYQVGYWGILALGLIFVVKNLPRRAGPRDDMNAAPRRVSSKITNDRLNH